MKYFINGYPIILIFSFSVKYLFLNQISYFYKHFILVLWHTQLLLFILLDLVVWSKPSCFYKWKKQRNDKKSIAGTVEHKPAILILSSAAAPLIRTFQPLCFPRLPGCKEERSLVPPFPRYCVDNV